MAWPTARRWAAAALHRPHSCHLASPLLTSNASSRTAAAHTSLPLYHDSAAVPLRSFSSFSSPSSFFSTPSAPSSSSSSRRHLRRQWSAAGSSPFTRRETLAQPQTSSDTDHSAPPPPPLSEQEEYERDVHRLYEERQRSQQAEMGGEGEERREEEEEEDEGRWGDVGVFVPHSVDVASDPAVAALRSASLASSLRGYHLHRLLRWKAAVREAVLEELGQREELRGVPICCHATRMSGHMRDATVQWHLQPLSPSSSVVRLPAALQGQSLAGVVGQVQNLLERCVGRIRMRLAQEEPQQRRGRSIAVPQVRFAFDDGERVRRRREADRRTGVEGAMRQQEERKAKELLDEAREEELQALEVDDCNPFWRPTQPDRVSRLAPPPHNHGRSKSAAGRTGGREGSSPQRRRAKRGEAPPRRAEVHRAGPPSPATGRARTPQQSPRGSHSRAQQLAAVIAQQRRMREG